MLRLITAASVLTLGHRQLNRCPRSLNVYCRHGHCGARGQKAIGTIEVPAGSDAGLSILSQSFTAPNQDQYSRWSRERMVLNTLRSSRSKS